MDYVVDVVTDRGDISLKIEGASDAGAASEAAIRRLREDGHADTRITERHYTDKKIALSQKLERVTLDIDRGKDDSGGVTHDPHTSEQREGAPIANRASQHQRRGAPSVVRGDSPYSHGPAGDAAGRGTANAGGGTRTPTDTCDESVRDQAGDAPSFDAVTEVVQQYLRFALASLAQRSRRDADPDS